MPEVVMFCVSDKVSGGERYSVDFLNGLSNLGWKTSLVGTEESGLADASRNSEINFVETSRLGPKLGKRTVLRLIFSWVRQVAEFQKIVRSNPQAVIVLQYKLEQLIWATISVRRPCIYLEHGPIPRAIKLPLIRGLYRRGIRRTIATFAASKPAAADLERMGANPHLVLAGVASRRKSEALEGAAAQRVRIANLVRGDLIGVYAGRITTAKGVLRAAEACMASERLGLVIMGDGPQLPELKEMIAGHPNVHYAGIYPDALAMIAAADFSLLLTEDPGEGRPLFAVESVAVGTPVVGLLTSAAMVGLQEEFGNGAVQLISSSTTELIEAAVADLCASELTATVPTWEESAKTASKLMTPA